MFNFKSRDFCLRGIIFFLMSLAAVAFIAAPSTSMAAPYAYIANLTTDNVSVLDTATNTVITTVTVGDGPYGVAVSPDNSRVYVANLYGHTVSVINTATNTVVATVGVGTNPRGAAVSPDNSRVYATNMGSDTVSVINTATNTVIATVTVGDGPYGVAISPDGSRVYVTNNFGNTISVINTADNTVIATVVSVGASPQAVAVSPDSSRVYVANRGLFTVSVINTADNTVIAAVPVGAAPEGVAVSPDGSRVYVTNSGTDTVSVINTATNTVIATVTVGDGPYGVAISPDGSRVYVTNNFGNTISVINTADNTVIATVVSVGASPQAVAVSPDSSRVYVANRGLFTVSVINTADNTVIAAVPVGAAPEGVAVSPDNSRVYVTNAGTDTVSVINTADNTIAATVIVGIGASNLGKFISHGSNISPSPASKDFGFVTSGSTSAAQTFTISNTGNANLIIGAITLTGTNASEFTIQNDNCSSQTVLQLGNCTVQAVFSPASAGSKTAALSIPSNDLDTATLSVALSATGLTSAQNNPPSAPTLVYPAHGQTVIGTTVTFRWTRSTDPDGNPVTYDLYYCANPDPTACSPINVASLTNKSRTTYYAGLIYWQGALFAGIILAGSIRRKRKIAALIAALAIAGMLFISCGSGNSSSNSDVTYTASGLNSGTQHSWKIVAKDNNGGETPSETRSYTTSF